LSIEIDQAIKEMSRTDLESFAYSMSCEQDRLHRLLRLIPPCPKHGEFCMSHATDWIKAQLANSTTTDCRGETGITVGLVDAIITMSRLLMQRDLSAPEIQEALKDLRQDEDLVKALHG